MLALYRAALRLRRGHPGLAGEELPLAAGPGGVLHFERDAGFRCVVNLSGTAFALPTQRTTLLRSDPSEDDLLPPDAAAWYLAR